MKMGSGINGEFTFLDTIAIVSFILSAMNYDENLSQSDKQEIMQELSEKLDKSIQDVHLHLVKQDAKLDAIIKALEGTTYDGREYI